MRNTESWKLWLIVWLIVASTFLLLVGYQYWAVPETSVVQYGRAVVLKGATVAAFGQLITLLVPVALVLVAGLTLDRMAPPIPD
jgi:ABC-type transport system involved in multi-copper enzyme maturation permease subunit